MEIGGKVGMEKDMAGGFRRESIGFFLGNSKQRRRTARQSYDGVLRLALTKSRGARTR
jgi:hypothetical protein